MHRTNLTAALALLLLSLAGCDQNAKSPYDIEVEQRSSAVTMAGRIDHTTKRLRDHETKARATIDKLPTMADKLSETDWARVEELVEAADQAGKDGAFAATMRDIDAAQTFFEEEKDELTKKIGGGVQYAAKQKSCELDAWGAVSASLKDGVGERFEERMKGINDAFLVIDRNRDALNRKNLPALEEMANQIALASYVVHQELPGAKLELEGSVAAGSDAREKIQKLLDEEKEPPKDKPSPDALKSQKDRIKLAEDALKKLDIAEADAKANLADLEQRTSDVGKAYDEALGKLKDAIKAKKK